MIPHSKPTVGHEEKEVLQRVIDSGQIAQGPEVSAFENEVAQFIGLPEAAVATNSGSSALHLALLALDVGEGDEVILPTFVCTALLNAISMVRAKPVVVDVNKEDFNINLDQLDKHLTNRTKAIIIPHMFGSPVDIKSLKKYDIPIIEDCAHSIGAQSFGNQVGSLGTISVFSFYATKMITTGEGGMVLSKNPELLEKMRDLRDYDGKADYRLRFNYKMTDLQAALGRVQLRRLSSFIQRRKEIAELYSRGLSSLPLKLPKENGSIFYRYIIQLPEENLDEIKQLEGKLLQDGIGCSRAIEIPLHQYLKLPVSQYSICEALLKSSLSLPIYPSLTDSEVEFIVSHMADYYASVS